MSMQVLYTQEFSIDRYHWESFSSRSCALTLTVGDLAFADFGRDTDDALFLLRISFDGYGCCVPDRAEVSPMDVVDSERLSAQVASGQQLVTDENRALLRRYFEAHRNVVWEDALIDYGLVSMK